MRTGTVSILGVVVPIRLATMGDVVRRRFTQALVIGMSTIGGDSASPVFTLPMDPIVDPRLAVCRIDRMSPHRDASRS
jgi:hypothetical protein